VGEKRGGGKKKKKLGKGSKGIRRSINKGSGGGNGDIIHKTCRRADSGRGRLGRRLEPAHVYPKEGNPLP